LLDVVGERPTDAKLRGLCILIEYGGRPVPTRAGIILFGREQAIHFPDAQIRCVQFRGADKSKPVVKSEDRGDTALGGIEAAVRFIERNTDRIVRITGRTRREELDPYPPPAVREVLNNAVAHADYAVEGASIFVALYSDRLEISSPGTWPPGFSREDFESGVSPPQQGHLACADAAGRHRGLRERARPRHPGLPRRRLPRARVDRERSADQGDPAAASE